MEFNIAKDVSRLAVSQEDEPSSPRISKKGTSSEPETGEKCIRCTCQVAHHVIIIVIVCTNSPGCEFIMSRGTFSLNVGGLCRESVTRHRKVNNVVGKGAWWYTAARNWSRCCYRMFRKYLPNVLSNLKYNRWLKFQSTYILLLAPSGV